MNNIKNYLYLFIGVIGLAQVIWLSFNIELPLFMHFISLPLLILPSLTMVILGLSKSDYSC